MRKILSYGVAGILLFAAACTDNTLNKEDQPQISSLAFRACASMEVLDAHLSADPGLRTKMEEIENFTRQVRASGEMARLVNGTIEIPVVVNVIYNTPEENISEAQIQSQIDVLNEDFNKQNADASTIPTEFNGVAANYGIRFVLDAINRKQSSKKSWQTNDGMKKSKQGGIDATDPETKLNIWVVNQMTSGKWVILGYAQFPGGNPATDGVVIGHQFFGRTGTVVAPFNKGRTATHEVGHWLNLRHIWGDSNCGNDFVDDTPVAQTSNYGCPVYPYVSTCGNDGHSEMTMNYMDYTDDACMYMFTNGQKARSLALFAQGGARESFVAP
jgi:hypothetical protein